MRRASDQRLPIIPVPVVLLEIEFLGHLSCCHSVASHSPGVHVTVTVPRPLPMTWPWVGILRLAVAGFPTVARVAGSPSTPSRLWWPLIPLHLPTVSPALPLFQSTPNARSSRADLLERAAYRSPTGARASSHGCLPAFQRTTGMAAIFLPPTLVLLDTVQNAFIWLMQTAIFYGHH